ncbi:LysR family transcriptional regulator [Granulosicoccus sp. 3-233]|uniref:LysR family transcriptional regulator n=1 Tax=Granulosicoccus sp. 3-233 TaxID=3417969 RepID=UPI003D3430AD
MTPCITTGEEQIIKIQQLKFFVAVYEEGSFSAAAVRVNATQSGLSMHVRELEKRYDVKFFHRSSTGVEPTETGRHFYKSAISVLSATEAAQDKLRELSGALSDHINVGLMPAFARAVLGPTLLRFTQEHEHVRVSVREAYSGQLSNDVAEGKLDFAVVPFYNSDLELNATTMGLDQECLVCSAETGLTLGSEAVLSELPPLRMVLPSKVNARRPRLEHYFSVNGIKLAETMELDTMLGTLDLVANSDWVSILPAVLSPSDKDGRKRLFTPLASPPLAVEYMRITHKAHPLSRAAQAFADVLQQELNNVLEADPLSAR